MSASFFIKKIKKIFVCAGTNDLAKDDSEQKNRFNNHLESYPPFIGHFYRNRSPLKNPNANKLISHFFKRKS